MQNDHEQFMRAAMQEAARGGAEGNIAVGSVIVRNNEIVGRGRNLVTTTRDPTDHAETVALRDASRALCRSDFTGCTLYSTIESCPMCCGAIMVSGISTLVLGARFKPDEFVSHRLGGYTVEKLIEMSRWGDRISVITGVLSDDCLAIRREWQERQSLRSIPSK
jgi:tRNA(adenine34) deaminase